MQAKLCTKPKLLSEFLEICTKNKYFAATIDKNILKDVKFLDHSSNVQANIERQWLFKSKDIENSLKTFSNTDFMEYGENLTLLEKHAIIRKRDRLSRSIPFGLIDIENDGKATQFGGGSIDNGGNSSDASIGIWLNNGAKHLTCWYLVNDKQSQEYFYRIQRLRKIWWMKYAANPGRFVISEVKQDTENDKKSVSIKANYPFGAVDIETVEVQPLDLSDTPTEIKSKSSAPTKAIKTSVVSEVAVIETVLDSIDAGDFGEMCLHRKVAPYQCIVYSLCQDDSISNDLKELVKYVSMLLQRSNISILYANDCHFVENTAVQRKFTEMDAIGIPYGILLDSDSLKSGFMKLRNRDTTLSETIHISQLSEYLPKIFQS